MAPLVRRTWAPRGVTPIIRPPGRHHQKITMIGALALSPRYHHVRLLFALLENANATGAVFALFLRAVLRHIPGPIVLVWDRLAAHRSRAVQEVLARHPRLHIEYLPPYAPELDPVEYLWSYLKLNPLANEVPETLHTLATRARRHTRTLPRRQALLRGFFNASGLFHLRSIGH